ncbi:MAG: D-alanine--D-alanine ligase [Bacteroidia bacterium]
MKITVGILFGGRSKEREISFAGGRTVYDNLDKRLFDPIPIFIDSFNNFIELDWEFVYKGSIRDFYPGPDHTPYEKGNFQIYAESLGNLDRAAQEEVTKSIGKRISVEELKDKIDIAFLCLHGPFGEDGRLQGLLEYHEIPYTGSGILSSAVGINKIIQKNLMLKWGFDSPAFFSIHRQEWLNERNAVKWIKKAEAVTGFPCVVKSPTQGSSIGVSVIHEPLTELFEEAIDKSLFIRNIKSDFWSSLSSDAKTEYVRQLCDIREGIGVPVRIGDEEIYHPFDLEQKVERLVQSGSENVLVESTDAESEVMIEGFIEGKEFSSIVIEDESGKPVCLPPTEIRKGKEIFDYRSKYLPGLSRKITPIQLPDEHIQKIRHECEKLYSALGFGVYARIDGFITEAGHVFLNDPNTTSGMMPSLFFFHQAAEIGFNPSQFITYIIATSLKRRQEDFKFSGKAGKLLSYLNAGLDEEKGKRKELKKIAVIFGGYSSERHISVESGRNIYEKLSSSDLFEPYPVFLSGNDEKHDLFTIPINLMLKDNADDILEKINHFTVHPVIAEIIEQCKHLTKRYGDVLNLKAPEKIDYQKLASKVDEVFIALHGRPGEDGAIQLELTKVGLPFNGSDANTSSITIDKYRTNELLKEHGMLIAEHFMVEQDDWFGNKEEVLERVKSIGFPLIAKPVDDGCSSAVKKIHNEEDLKAFATLIFRTSEEFDAESAKQLKVKPKEEFPIKKRFLIESLIGPNEASQFLEITGGMLTHLNHSGEMIYEVFEASEALSEGEVLSLEEKFLAGQGQNITPARYAKDSDERQRISNIVKDELEKAARVLNIQGYCRIDAFVRVYDNGKVEVIFIEVNSLPGMTPATCIFHQTAINGYKPYDFIEKIMTFAEENAHRGRQTV